MPGGRSSRGEGSEGSLEYFRGTFSGNLDEAEKQLAIFIKSHIVNIRGVAGMTYSSGQIHSLLAKIKPILKSQDTLVRVKAPVKVVGDIHGQYTDLKRLLYANGYPPDIKYIFLGDYVDRGKHSLECMMLMFAYKTLYPGSVVLLRGNHECRETNRNYGFYDELVRRSLQQTYPEFNDVFDYLPLAAIVDGKILCMHGGISKYLKDIDQIRKIKRPCSMHPEASPDIAVDLLWADPDKRISGFAPSTRNISFVFGLDALEKFCHRAKIDLIVRGHQVVEKGFERFGPEKGRTRLVTVFSAPNYCNEFDNSAAVMNITEKLKIEFSVLEPTADANHNAQRNQERQSTPKFDVFPDANSSNSH